MTVLFAEQGDRRVPLELRRAVWGLVNQYLASVNLLVRKTADESVLNSTALQDDNELLLPVAPNAIYLVEGLVVYDGSTTGDLLMGWSAPAGASFDWTISGLNSAAAAESGSVKLGAETLGTSENVGAIGAGLKMVTLPRGVLVTAGVAGNLQFRWAQNALDAVVPTTVFAGSVLTARQVV